MSHHLSSESLSVYLDGEATPAEARAWEAHLAACEPCRLRLDAARRLVGSLWRLARSEAPPPPELAAQVRRRIALRPLHSLHPLHSLRSLRSWRSRIWWRGLPPLRGAFSAPLGAGLALLVAVLLVEHGSVPGLGTLYPAVPAAPPARPQPEFLVSEGFGDAPAVLRETTSEVAGRVFVWNGDTWVQRGLDAVDVRQPRARVPAHSPAGRELLAKYSDLGVLLADGSRVVMRYNLETLELSNGS
jgi:Putative zinc-finger